VNGVILTLAVGLVGSEIEKTLGLSYSIASPSHTEVDVMENKTRGGWGTTGL